MKLTKNLSPLLATIVAIGLSAQAALAQPSAWLCGLIKVNGQPTEGVVMRFYDCVSGVFLDSRTTTATEIVDGMAHNYLVPLYDGRTDTRVELEYLGCTATAPCGQITVLPNGKLMLDFDMTCASGIGTGTPGYWKNHPEAWPVASIDIGGVTYSQSLAIALMSTPESGDKSYNVFRNLVSAKLNVLNGSQGSCITAEIAAADAWMALHAPGSGVAGKSDAWKEIDATATKLDDYNNGYLCAAHRN